MRWPFLIDCDSDFDPGGNTRSTARHRPANEDRRGTLETQVHPPHDHALTKPRGDDYVRCLASDVAMRQAQALAVSRSVQGSGRRRRCAAGCGRDALFGWHR